VRPDATRFRPVRWLLTLFMVVLGWVMFRAENVGIALRMYGAMFRHDPSWTHWQLGAIYAGSIDRLQIATLLLAVAVVAISGARQRLPDRYTWSPQAQALTAVSLLTPLFLLSLLKLSAQSYSPFLYFQF